MNRKCVISLNLRLTYNKHSGRWCKSYLESDTTSSIPHKNEEIKRLQIKYASYSNDSDKELDNFVSKNWSIYLHFE